MEVLTAITNLEWYEESSLSLLDRAIVKGVGGKTAVVSSFGAESAVLLHLVSRVDRSVPVLFIDTRMMFQETLDYQRELAAHLNLTDVREISADSEQLRRQDVFGRLHLKDPDACCNLRKTIPLREALKDFDSWINGRKRHQTSDRAALQPVEVENGERLKFNPLLHWDRTAIEAYFDTYSLPRHPLAKEGFTSIGCAPCTARANSAEDQRAGRWAGLGKTECGIHFANDETRQDVA